MDVKYPFIPKSNAGLKPGQFWPIRLSNGNYGCGIVLDLPTAPRPGGKRLFYTGLLDWVSNNKPTVASLEAQPLAILDHGQVHIKTILKSNAAIEGHLDLQKNNLQIALVVDSRNYSPSSQVLRRYVVVRKATVHDHETLKIESTWGYGFINILAEKFLVGQ